MEICNHGCAVGCDRPEGAAIADLLLSEGRRLTLIATDDAHVYEPDHFGGWVMVKAAANTPEDLPAASTRGDFCPSQGPEIHTVSPDAAAAPLARFRTSPWLRITVVDAHRRRAWTKPVWRDPA